MYAYVKMCIENGERVKVLEVLAKQFFFKNIVRET